MKTAIWPRTGLFPLWMNGRFRCKAAIQVYSANIRFAAITAFRGVVLHTRCFHIADIYANHLKFEQMTTAGGAADTADLQADFGNPNDCCARRSVGGADTLVISLSDSC